MPEWTLNPWNNFPQTPELYLGQTEQELASAEERTEYLLEERARIVSESKD